MEIKIMELRMELEILPTSNGAFAYLEQPLTSIIFVDRRAESLNKVI
jgi:hypothetical protein